MLKVRICTDEFLAQSQTGGRWLVSRPAAPGLRAVLVLDHPDRVGYPLTEVVESWGKKEEVLFDLAIENVRSEDRPQLERLELAGGGAISSLSGGTFFTATWVLMLDDYLRPASPHGALVAVPNRHQVLFHSILDLSVVEASSRLIQVAARAFTDGPGSISPNLYWRRDGVLTLLPTRLDGKRIIFAPPNEFVDVLNSLEPHR